jgi:type III restriction enzyme
VPFLEILDRITEITPLNHRQKAPGAMAAIHGEFPSVTDFERDFPSLYFALATGVGKTRLAMMWLSARVLPS